MAKKRKLRSSEPESSIAPEPEQSQPPEQQQQDGVHEEEQQEQTHFEPNEEQQDNMVEDEPKNEVQEEEEDEEEEEEQQQQDEETLATSNDVVPAEPAPPEANGDGNAAEDGGDDEEDEDDEESEEEPVETLLEPFAKEQLIVLLREAVDKYPELMDSVRKVADADPSHRKIFIHGLGWDSNAETLTSVFSKYGEIEDCKAVCDKISGKSKGYGFILFKHRSGARKALKQPQKKIGSRMTSCQLASAGPVPAPPPVAPPVSEYTQRKIFVSNVSADIDPQKLLEYFSRYGEIDDGPLGLDKHTGKPKGFALFVYKSVESAKKALEEPHKTFEGHTLHCQKAIDGPKPSKPYNYHPQHHTHHHSRKENPKYSSGAASAAAGGSGHLMAPSGPGVGFNQGVVQAALNPALGQALTALLATQGAGLGLTNLLGGLGAPVNQTGPPMQGGYGNQAGGSYGSQPGMQGGYQNPQMGQGNAGRPQQGGAPYMGH